MDALQAHKLSKVLLLSCFTLLPFSFVGLFVPGPFLVHVLPSQHSITNSQVFVTKYRDYEPKTNRTIHIWHDSDFINEAVPVRLCQCGVLHLVNSIDFHHGILLASIQDDNWNEYYDGPVNVFQGNYLNHYAYFIPNYELVDLFIFVLLSICLPICLMFYLKFKRKPSKTDPLGIRTTSITEDFIKFVHSFERP